MIVNLFRVFVVISSFLFTLATSAQENLEQIQTSGAAEAYRFSPGDVVSVTVFGEQDISVERMRVPLSGVYNYPLIGELELIDKTPHSLARELETRLRAGFLSDPKVSVNIVEYRPVIVTGSVESPGKLSYQEGMTLRILSALAQVDIRNMKLDQVEIQRDALALTPTSADFAILPGDIVSFKQIVATVNSYYIYGEVNRSGKYDYEDGLTVEQAIIVAGGYTPFASKKNIRVRRDGAEDSLKVKLHESVEPGDVITVKKRWF